MAQVIKRENGEWTKEKKEHVITKCFRCSLLESGHRVPERFVCECKETDRH